MRRELQELLAGYADRYETPAFLEDDPSRFMHQYNSLPTLVGPW